MINNKMGDINDIVKHMWEYQKQNKIVRQCVTNSVYLRDQLNGNGYYAKVKAVILISFDFETETVETVGGHLVVEIGNNQIIDSSYETNTKQNTKYFGKISDLLLHFPMIKDNKEILLGITKLFVQFNKIADDINNDTTIFVADKEYYYKQADYVEMMMGCKRV